MPLLLPRLLPDDWKGGFAMLVVVFVLSSFLDNIAAAMIGGTMATALYRGRVHVGFLAAIVAASNAGGSGSVVGDTTTTMMWIDGVQPLQVLEAYVAAIPGAALLRRRRRAPATRLPADHEGRAGRRSPSTRAASASSPRCSPRRSSPTCSASSSHGAWLDRLPAIGLAVWAALLAVRAVGAARLERPAVGDARRRSSSSASCCRASMMPIEALPAASWQVALGLGFVSAVFDNIPLTALALRQGGYDWGFLAYAVGFGGSMIWFGSSAGVALASQFPAGALGQGLGHGGWHVAVGYVLGFFVLLLVLGWHPDPAR